MSYLAGKSVVITGASSGIGAYLARELVARGARVGLLARRADRLQELADQLQSEKDSGTVAAWRVADVVDDDGLAKALDELEDELGGVDIVVANAGYGQPEPPHRFKPGSSMRMYDTNLFGMLRLFDWALPRFIERRSGHLVGVASVASYLGMTNSASYCGSKAAMRVHLQGLRVGLKRYGIAVTTICPGFVKSELTDKAKFNMPFLLETEASATKIANALERRASEVIFPWQMYWLTVFCSRFVPRAWLEGFMTNTKPPR